MDEPDDIEEAPEPDTVNSADPASVARASKRAKTWLAQRRQFWLATMSTEIGRKAIWEFLTLECSFGNVPVATSPSGHPDPMATMYWNGVKHPGDRLYDLLQRTDHAAVFQMRCENDPEFSRPRVKPTS